MHAPTHTPPRAPYCSVCVAGQCEVGSIQDVSYDGSRQPGEAPLHYIARNRFSGNWIPDCVTQP